MNFIENLQNIFLSALFIRGGNPVQPPVGTVKQNNTYPQQFFNPDKFQGSWKEIARTPNSVQTFDGEEAIHEFKANPSNQIEHQVKQGRKKFNHTLNMNFNNKDLFFSDVNNNYFGSPSKAHLIGLYDPMLNLVTQPDNQPCTYCLLAQGNDRLWMLARPGYENNNQAIAHMMNFSQKLGYKPEITNPNLIQQIKNGASNEVTVLWNSESFPQDGSARIINIGKEDAIRFKSTDGKLHTVAQADENWKPHPHPKIESPPSSREFNRSLIIGEPGVYYLACPVGTNHRTMRMKVNVFQ